MTKERTDPRPTIPEWITLGCPPAQWVVVGFSPEVFVPLHARWTGQWNYYEVLGRGLRSGRRLVRIVLGAPARFGLVPRLAEPKEMMS